MEQQQSEQNTLSQTIKPSNELHHKVHKLSRIFVIFSAIIGIATSIFFFYFYLTYQPPQATLSTSKPRTAISPAASDADMENWKTYTNDDLKFSFEYPGDYELDEEGYFYPASLSQEQRYSNSKIGSVNIINTSSTITKECNIKYELHDNPVVLSKDSVNTNKIFGIKELIETTYLGDNGEGYGELYIYSFCFNINKKTFTLSLFSYNKTYDADKKLFDQILSTFKFLDTMANITFEIENGDVYKTAPNKEKKLFLDKNNLIDTSNSLNSPVDEIVLIEPSPDKSKLIIEANHGLSLQLLYYSDINAKNIKWIGFSGKSVWSPNSQYIAFTSKPADAGPMQILYLYDTKTDKSIRLEAKEKTQNHTLGYSNLRWLEDSSGIKVHYENYEIVEGPPLWDKIGEGETIIYLNSQ